MSETLKLGENHLYTGGDECRYLGCHNKKHFWYLPLGDSLFLRAGEGLDKIQIGIPGFRKNAGEYGIFNFPEPIYLNFVQLKLEGLIRE